ncbi:MAG: alanine:cation symporter family protein [Clostridiales bacterium]|nr:alanine:cation symporter family protein [Clostridiales bacterium]
MSTFLDGLNKLNLIVYTFIWERAGLILLIGTGVFITLLTKGFQITHFRFWMKKTIGSIFQKDVYRHTKEKGAISPFQAMCTSLAATVGVGNIAGVGTAIVFGGPGAVFWMWIAALFGMMTSFAENVLAVYYRSTNEKGELVGGAMYYLRNGLGGKPGCKKIGQALAVLFSVCCLLASFGIGNMSQINTIAVNFSDAFRCPPLEKIAIGSSNLYMLVIGLVLMIVAALVILGGLQRISNVTEKVVPFMVLFYLLGSGVIVVLNYQNILPAFAAIFKGAFGAQAAVGGAVGISVRTVMTWGFKRGVFSNEAGLGSTTIINAASSNKEPVGQGLWGIFEVFVDTIVVCSLTALVILTSGLVDFTTGEMLTDSCSTTLVSEAFSQSFGSFGGSFMAISILLFAFSTVLGWSYYGTKAWEFLFGTKSTKIYKILFIMVIATGAVLSLESVWSISDTFNGMMMLPNLVGVLLLSGQVLKITKNYIDREIKGISKEPILSYKSDKQEK